MGLFDGIRDAFQPGGSRNEKWKLPGSEEDLKYLFEPSSGTHLIYKHSFACGICFFSKNQIENLMDNTPQISGWHFIDVRKQRYISGFVASQSGIRHESPQAILLHNGEVIWHGSHSAVRTDAIKNALQDLEPSS